MSAIDPNLPPPSETEVITDVPHPDDGHGNGGNGHGKSTALRGLMRLGEAVEIDLERRLPAYSNNYVGCYAAKSLGSDSRDLIAYVCEPQFTPRNRQGPSYANLSNPSLLPLVASGVGSVQETGVSRFVFIYEDVLGNPIANNDINYCGGMRQDKLMEKVVNPLIGALKDMRDADLTHGAIRPGNLFDGGKENYDNVILGDCLSLPGSMSQPIMFEPIDRAMAQPTGRGLGSNQDDLYSFGVTVALLARTRDPMKGKVDVDVIGHKMQFGTYATLVSPEEHFSSSMVELLRGLLIDDRRLRWTMDDVLTWMDGRRLSPKQAPKKQKAARALSFHGKSYSQPNMLGRDLFTRVQETVQLVESGDLEQWIKRSLEDDLMLSRYLAGIRSAEDQGRGASFWDRLVSRMGLVLDPTSPIRFKNIAVTGEGISTALAEAFVSKKDITTFKEILSSSLISFWMNILTDLNYDMAPFFNRFETCRNYIHQPAIGFGLERVLYFLNEDVHCLSPAIERFYVRTPEEFLEACEVIAALPDDKRPTQMMDRHSTAFLSAKDRKICEPFLFDLASTEPYRHVLGTLQVLASIQRYYRMPNMPNLGLWVAQKIEPLYERYHDAENRKMLRQKIDEVADKGDLSRILSTIDNAELLRTDLLNFRRAMRDYRLLINEKDELIKRLSNVTYFGRREGRETSVILSGIIATMMIIGVIVMYMNGARLL